MQVLKSSDIVSIVGTGTESVLPGLSRLYGTSGRTGLPGLPGLSGLSGLPGMSGLPGLPGRSGMVNLSGVGIFQRHPCALRYIRKSRF